MCSEEEEEGICITSDVVKVKGEDLDTPGYLRLVRGDRVRSDVCNPARYKSFQEYT